MRELTVVRHMLCNCQDVWKQTYRLLIDVVPFTPIFTAIDEQVRDRVSWYVVVVYWNLQTRTRKNALFVSP
jgi:hypothetical protein